MERKTYNIDGKMYSQGPIVPAQLKQLYGLIEKLAVTEALLGGAVDAKTLLNLFGDKISEFSAIVLVPEGVRLKDKDVNALAEEFDGVLPVETALQVVEDFFICNPIFSLVEKVKGLIVKIKPPAKEEEAQPTA